MAKKLPAILVKDTPVVVTEDLPILQEGRGMLLEKGTQGVTTGEIFWHPMIARMPLGYVVQFDAVSVLMPVHLVKKVKN
jgi:hypothetical protein